MGAELHPEFRDCLHAEIGSRDPGTFATTLERLVARAVDKRAEWSIGLSELKLLVRHRCRLFDEVTSSQTFADGAHIPFFVGFYAADDRERRLLLEALEAMHNLSQKLDDPVSAAAATTSRVIHTWSRLARRNTPLDPTPATQLMLWRVFESIVKGELEMARMSLGPVVRHHPRFAEASKLVERRSDPRRAEILSSLKFTLGCASLRRPPLGRLIERDKALSDEHREALVAAVSSRDPKTADPISALLRHHIELVALAGFDRVEPFADLLSDFVTHLRTDVLTVGRAPENAATNGYLRILQERYLPGLFNYARILRKARLDSPFLGDLLHEAYLVRTRSLDGDAEPSFARLLQDWTAAQRVIQARAGYKSDKGFSFAQAYLDEAAPMADAPLERTGTERGLPVRALGEYETFIELPRQDAPLTEAPASFGSADVDDGAETTPFQRVQSSELGGTLPPIAGPPPTGPSVLPARLGSMDNLYSAPTEILPVLSDDAVDLHTAVTEILPTNPDGTVDLQRVATQLFPKLPDETIELEDEE